MLKLTKDIFTSIIRDHVSYQNESMLIYGDITEIHQSKDGYTIVIVPFVDNISDPIVVKVLTDGSLSDKQKQVLSSLNPFESIQCEVKHTELNVFTLVTILAYSGTSVNPVMYCQSCGAIYFLAREDTRIEDIDRHCCPNPDIIITHDAYKYIERKKRTMEDKLFDQVTAAKQKEAQDAIDAFKQVNNDSCGCLSDGYHTFDELYHHRALLFASLCNTAFKNHAWKSLLHHDPKEPMYPGMFIVGVDTPYGQATYHYNIDPYWKMFNVEERDRAPEFDGHTPAEAVERIYKFSLDFGKPQTREFPGMK